MDRLAIEGGKPVRNKLLPYGHQWVDEADIQAVVKVLRSDWLTTGPKVAEFEQVFAAFVGAREAAAVSSGTAALHAAMYAADIGAGDSARGIREMKTFHGVKNIPRAEVIVSPMTFASSANCIVFQGGTPVFADVDPDTLLLDPAQVEAKITPRTKAIIAVDYTGQPCDYDALRAIANRHDLILVADACHALGGNYKGQPVGSLADLSTFSFHPVKHITTGEGGMVTTDDPALAQRMRVFRNHGITTDHRQREQQGSWFYEMVDLGYNYRLTDLQCALGISQLLKLPGWVTRRQKIAKHYDKAFAEMPEVITPVVKEDRLSAWHLYVIRLDLDRLTVGRAEVFRALSAENIGVNVHYIPVYWHPFYQKLGYTKGICPIAEAAYERILSLPIYPAMSDGDVEDVIISVDKVITYYRGSEG